MRKIRLSAVITAFIVSCSIVLCGCDSESEKVKESSSVQNTTNSVAEEYENSEEQPTTIEISDSKEEVLENLKKAYDERDEDAYLETFPDEIIEPYLEINGVTRETFSEVWEDQLNKIEEEVGKNLEVSYEIISETKYTNEEIELHATKIEEKYGVRPDIEEACNLIVYFDFKGDSGKQEYELHMIFVKIDGEWKTTSFL